MERADRWQQRLRGCGPIAPETALIIRSGSAGNAAPFRLRRAGRDQGKRGVVRGGAGRKEFPYLRGTPPLAERHPRLHRTRLLTKVGLVLPDERHPVSPRTLAADHAACVMAKGCSERGDLEPRFSLMARMNATMVQPSGVVWENATFRQSSADQVVQFEFSRTFRPCCSKHRLCAVCVVPWGPGRQPRLFAL